MVSTSFFPHLHSAVKSCIFASAKEARGCFLFFVLGLTGSSFGPNGLSKGLFRAYKRGCLSFSLRPFDLVTTAKSHPVFNFSGKKNRYFRFYNT